MGRATSKSPRRDKYVGAERPTSGSPRHEIRTALASPARQATPTRQDRATAHQRWLSVRDIATDLAFDDRTVRRWLERGYPYGPRHSKLPNGQLRVRVGDYEEWLAQF